MSNEHIMNIHSFNKKLYIFLKHLDSHNELCCAFSNNKPLMLDYNAKISRFANSNSKHVINILYLYDFSEEEENSHTHTTSGLSEMNRESNRFGLV